MSTTTQQIENIVSIVQENATIAEQNANMANAVNLISMSNEELMLGKQKIVDAINKMGGSASIDDTLSGLAKALRKLGMLDPEIGLTDDAPKPINLGDWISGDYGKYIKTAKSDKVIEINNVCFQNSNLEELNFPNLKTASSTRQFSKMTAKRIFLPSLESIGSQTFMGVKADSIYLPKLHTLLANTFDTAAIDIINLPSVHTSTIGNNFLECKAREIYLPLLKTGVFREFYNSTLLEVLDLTSYPNLVNNTGNFQNVKRLIDLIIGGNIKGDVSFSASGYNPTEAYSKSSASLCYDTDIDRYGQRFSRNWDKWKWCIINHFAANLEDRTGLDAFTITFGATVLAQFDEDMIEAFTNKNWTLA